MVQILKEAPPWFTGWIAITPCLFFSIAFLYYGFRYTKEAHVELIKDEGQPEIWRVLPWWAAKIMLIILGMGILLFCVLYFINVPEDF